MDGLLTIRSEDCRPSLVASLTPQDDGTVAVHATGSFDRLASPLRKAPRWLIGSTADVVVEAVLRPATAAQ